MVILEICDFGSDNDQITCDWSNRNGSILKWEYGAGSLSNWLGGPSKDANADPKGGYMFFETSLLASDSRIAQNAFIESSVLPTTSLEGKCISFQYVIRYHLSFSNKLLKHTKETTILEI